MNRKILYLHRTQGKGAEGSHIRGMVDGFRDAGWLVDILGPPGIDPYVEKNIGSAATQKVSWLKALWQTVSAGMPQILFEAMELAYNVHAYPRTTRALAVGSYGFIYERYALNTFYGARLARKHKLPYVLEVNDATVIERSRPLVLKKFAEKVERYVLEQASLIITISTRFKELLIEAHGISEDKFLVLPNAVNPDDYILDPKKKILRESLGIRKEQVVLGCAGAFVPWHGLDFMLHSLHEVIREKDIFVLFIGDGPVRADVEKIAARYGISRQVKFTGFVPAGMVPYYLDVVDICVIPDSNEHCSPMKLFEYMAVGKAIVLPNYKPLLEVVGDYYPYSIFFEKNTQDSFRRCVVKFIENKNFRDTLGDYLQYCVKTKFTWAENVKSVLHIVL